MKHTFRVFALDINEAQQLFERVAKHCYIKQYNGIAYNLDWSLIVSLKKSDLRRDVYFVEIVGNIDILSKILPEEDFSKDRTFHVWDASLGEEIAAMYRYYDSVL